jgi:RNA polymerase sigma factor (sigma-70 family)
MVAEDHKPANYTQALSREIDAAYEAYTALEPQSSERLYRALKAQASNILYHCLGGYDEHLERHITHRAMLALESFKGKSKLSTWFYTLAQNEANRELRSEIRNRNRHVFLDAPVEGEDGKERQRLELEAKPVNQEAELDFAKLYVGLLELSNEQAEVLSLMREGYSLTQVAEKTGKPIGTVRGRYRLAKNKIRAMLKRKNIPSDIKRQLRGLIT